MNNIRSYNFNWPWLMEYSPDRKESLEATMIFMRNFSKKIIDFLALGSWHTIESCDEISLRDLKDMEEFFSKFWDVNIEFGSEVDGLGYNISRKVFISSIQPRVALRIYWTFLDLFERFPSKYALMWLTEAAKIYEDCIWDNIISDDELKRKKVILLDFLIKWQENANKDPIYTDEETTQLRTQRLKELIDERNSI